MRAAMSAQRNKTDATDALALAHIVRTGWFRKAHIKTASCYRLRLLLTQRRNLKRKVLDLENTIRHSLKAFGIRIKGTGRGGFDAAVREAVADDALTSEPMDAMLAARAMLWKQYRRLRDFVVKFVARHELCRRFMAIPGVGPVTALSFVTAIDDPSRFRRSRDVAAYFGLTSRRWQSGTSIDVQGRISKAGDADVRRALYEAASALMTRFKGRDKVRTWGLALAKRSCHRKATVAVARKLAVIMHAIVDGRNLLRRRRGSQRQRSRGARRPGRMAGCWARKHERPARQAATPAYRHPDGRRLNKRAPLRRMRTGADQGQRDATLSYGMACPRRFQDKFFRVHKRGKGRAMEAKVIGIDLGKNICGFIGVNPAGQVVLRRRMRPGFARCLSPKTARVRYWHGGMLRSTSSGTADGGVRS